MERIIQIATALEELRNNPNPKLAKEYLEWVRGDGLEGLRPQLEKDLQKLTGRPIEVPVYRLDQLDQPLYYEMSSTQTVGDLRRLLAESIGVENVGIGIWYPNVTMTEPAQGDQPSTTSTIWGRLDVEQTAEGSKTDVYETIPLDEESGDRFVIYPIDGRLSWSDPIIPPERKLTMRIDVIGYPGVHIIIPISPGMTLANFRKLVWVKYGIPPPEQIYLKDTELVPENTNMFTYYEQPILELKRHRVEFHMPTWPQTQIVGVSVWDTVGDILQIFENQGLPENVGTIWMGAPGDPDRVKLAPEDPFIWDVVAVNPTNKPYYVEVPSGVVVGELLPLPEGEEEEEDELLPLSEGESEDEEDLRRREEEEEEYNLRYGE